MYYDTPSIRMFQEAKQSYCLGLFIPTILVCRSIAEQVAFELFSQKIMKLENYKLNNIIAESIDFRKIVNKILPEIHIISKEDKSIFNQIYDIGNEYVHPTNKKIAAK